MIQSLHFYEVQWRVTGQSQLLSKYFKRQDSTGDEVGVQMEVMENEPYNRRILQLTTLLEASNVINSGLHIRDVLDNILTMTVQFVQAEAGTLWVVDEESGRNRAACAKGPSSESIVGIELAAGEGIVGRVIESASGLLIEDVSKDARWASRIDEETGFVTRSMMTVPLVVKDQAIGAIQLLNKENYQSFEPYDLELATALSVQSALALHNSQMYDQMYRMYVSFVRTLATTLDARDPYTSGHSERVSQYSVHIARNMGLSETVCDQLNIAALLHDIGKVGVPDEVLLKPGRLTADELALMQRHTEIGAEILAKIEPKRMIQDAIDTARWHHERLDGSGYPDGLSGDEIPLFSRIVAVADSFDAMTTHRPYSRGRTFEEAMAELVRERETRYDARAVDAFQRWLHKEQEAAHGASSE